MWMPYRCGLMLWLLIVPSAWAEDMGGAQKALAKAQFMLRQATSEKTQLQQQVDTLRQQLDALQKQLTLAASDAAGRQQSLEKKFSEADDQWKTRGERSEQEIRSLREKLRAQTEQGEKLTDRLHRQTENFDLCYSNNKKLYGINVSLLERYRNKGWLDVMKQKEPFTGEAQVEAENLIQDYQYQLEDLAIGDNGKASSENQKAGP